MYKRRRFVAIKPQTRLPVLSLRTTVQPTQCCVLHYEGPASLIHGVLSQGICNLLIPIFNVIQFESKSTCITRIVARLRLNP